MRLSMMACAGLMVGATAAPAAAAKAPVCGADQYLNVTVADTGGTPPNEVPHDITSDGGGAYSNGGRGSNKIEARLQIENCSFDFTLNVYPSPRTMQVALGDNGEEQYVSEFFNIDRVASVPLTAAGPVPGSDFEVFCNAVPGVQRDAVTGRILKRGNVYFDNYGGCHQDGDGEWYVRRAAVFELARPDARGRLYFNQSLLDSQAGGCDSAPEICQASWARVYHPSANVWVVRQEAGGQGAALMLEGVFQGYDPTTFEITATRQ